MTQTVRILGFLRLQRAQRLRLAAVGLLAALASTGLAVGASSPASAAAPLPTTNGADWAILSGRTIHSSAWSGGSFPTSARSPHGMQVLGDLDGDGINEVVFGHPMRPTGNWGDRGAISVMFFNADGTIKRETQLDLTSLGSGALNVGYDIGAVGDWDDDGVADLITNTFEGNRLPWLLLLNADGSLKQAIRVTAAPTAPALPAAPGYAWLDQAYPIGDWDHDGVTDIAITDRYTGGTWTGEVFIMLMNSSGSIRDWFRIDRTTPGWVINGPLDEEPARVVGIGDIDNNGAPDMALGFFRNSADELVGRIAIILMNADRTIKSMHDYNFPDIPGNGASPGWGWAIRMTTAGDVDGNGVMDLIHNGGYISYLNSDGSVKRMSRFTDASKPTEPIGEWGSPFEGVVVGDIDGNGGLDILATRYWDSAGNSLRWQFGADIAPPAAPTAISVAPAFATGPVTVSGTAEPGSTVTVKNPSGTTLCTATAAAVTGAFACSGTLLSLGSVPVSATDAAGNVSVATTLKPLPAPVARPTTLGQDWKGKAELTINASAWSGGTFPIAARSPQSMQVIGDLDGDGINEVAFGSPMQPTGNWGDTGGVSILFFNADGTIKREQVLDLSSLGAGAVNVGYETAPLGDWDHDGVPDLVVNTYEGNRIGWILLLNVDGSLKQAMRITPAATAPALPPVPSFARLEQPYPMGDWDGDGITDLLVPDRSTGETVLGEIYVMLMNANGTIRDWFTISHTTPGWPATSAMASEPARALGLGDIDGNGAPDFAIGFTWDRSGDKEGRTAIVLMNPDRTIKSMHDYEYYDLPGSAGTAHPTWGWALRTMVAGDVDGNGVVDIINGHGVISYLNSDGTIDRISRYTEPSRINDPANTVWGEGFEGVVVGDINGDGGLDILASRFWDPARDSLHWLFGDVPDTTAPTPPTVTVSSSLTNGPITVSGNAEAGSTVTVKNPSGTTLCLTTATVGGTYSCSGTLAGTGTLSVTAADVFGNTSPVTMVELGGWYIPLATGPQRVLDTRVGSGTADGQMAGMGKRASKSVTTIPIAGRVGVPANAAVVELNLTVNDPSAWGFLTVYPCGEEVPNTSNLNYVARQTVSNAVLSRIGSNGAVCVYNYADTDVIIDVQGYALNQDSMKFLAAPVRLADSRSTQTIDGKFGGQGDLAAKATRAIMVAGRGGVPAGTRTAMLNITVSNPKTAGWLTVYPCADGMPNVSSMQFTADQPRALRVIAPLDANGEACLYTSDTTSLIVDLTGYAAQVSTYVALSAQARLVDSRSGGQTADGLKAGIGALTDGSTIEVQVTGRAGVPLTAKTAVLNVTSLSAGGWGFFTVYPCGKPVPNSSNLNHNGGGQNVASSVVAKIGVDGKVCIYSFAKSDLLVDISGYFSV